MLSLRPTKEIDLRPYQLDAVEGLRVKIREGKKRLILVAPTGAGKTVIASHLLRQADQKGSYALFMVDRVALVNQTSETLDDYGKLRIYRGPLSSEGGAFCLSGRPLSKSG